MAPYNLLEDMRGKGPDISWPQFLALCPQVRRELTKVVSTRRKTKENVKENRCTKIKHLEQQSFLDRIEFTVELAKALSSKKTNP